MTPTRLRLWKTLSQIPALRAPRRVWHAELGEHWELCHQFLSATSDLATWTFASDGVTHCDVVDHGDGTFVGINRLHGETFDVDRADQIICRLDLRKLSDALMTLLHGRVDFSITDSRRDLHRLGRLPPGLAAAPLFLSTRTDQASLISATMDIEPSSVLLVPSLQRSKCDVAAIESTFDVLVVAADDTFIVKDNAIAVSSSAIEELRFRLGLGDNSSTNTFRLNGDTREIRFSGTSLTLTESTGLWYLAEFLSRPNTTLSAVDLESARTGVTARSSTSGTGEQFDEQARREYQRTLNELDESIAEANANNDIGTAERLQVERFELIEHIRKASGLAGKSRVTTDESKSRKNIRQAMQRDIKRIARHHPKLAEHLSAAFKGNWLCYQPAEDPFWQF